MAACGENTGNQYIRTNPILIVEVYCRRNHWKPVGYYAEDTLYLESVGLTLKVSDIYRRVRKEVGLDVPYPMPDNQG